LQLASNTLVIEVGSGI